MAEIGNVTFACEDLPRLAEFWATVLDGERVELPDSFDGELVRRPDGPNLLFNDLPKGTERDLPIHLDLVVEDRETAVERFRDLGGAVRETKSDEFAGQTHTWTVMEDPEGNGFCVSEY